MKVLLLVVYFSTNSCSSWVSLNPSQQQLYPHITHTECISSTTTTAILSSDTRVTSNPCRMRLSRQSQFQRSHSIRHHHPNKRHAMVLLSSATSDNGSNDDTSSDDNGSNSDDATTDNNSNSGIDLSFDPRLYKVRLSRATGIE